MTRINQSKNNLTSLFNLQRGVPYDQSAVFLVGKKRDSPMFQSLPEFNTDAVDGKPTETIRKALSVLANRKLPPHPSIVNQNDKKYETLKLCSDASDASSVSTAPTSSESSISSVYEESDMETDQESEVPITSLTPDALFIVQGREFPCHVKILLREARPLYDIIFRDGSLERKTKKQRSSSSQRDQPEGHQSQEWSSPSGITVVRLPNYVDSDHFEVLIEFLYTKEIRLKLPEGYQEDSEEEDPWLIDEEDIFDDDDDDDDDEHLIGLSSSKDMEGILTATSTPLKFLQESFSFADRFGCTSLKTAIENKIYDEFLFSFTAIELFNWAEQNRCTYLKEKAKEKIPKPISYENDK